ncbi:MAG: hypothetical protein ACOCQ1_00835 [Halanaerobiaceae bacterium]
MLKNFRLNFMLVLLFVCLILFTGFNYVQAGMINDLVTIPSADLSVRQSVISGEFYPDQYRTYDFEFVHRVNSELEVGGVLSLYENNNSLREQIGLSLKYNIRPESSNQPAVSVGIKNRDLYLVMSKELVEGIRAHAGIGDGRYHNVFIGFNKIFNKNRVQIGDPEKQPFSFPPVNVMVEYTGREINSGLRVNLEQNFYIDLALMDFENFKAGVSFAF